MENNRQEDLDMISLMGAINKGLSSLFGGIGKLFRFTLTHFLVFASFMGLFAAVSLTMWYFKKPVFKSSIVLSHTRIENDYCQQIVKNLGNFIDGKENSKLAGEISLRPDYAKQIVSIAYFPLNEHMSRRFEDSVTVLLPFKIEVEIFDSGVLDTLQQKLLTYLENNDYARKLKQIDEEALQSIQSRVNNEINSLDSLKKVVAQSIIPRSQGNGIILGEPIDPVGIYKQSILLFDKKININKALEFNNTFHVRIGFPKLAKRSSAGPVAYLLVGSVIGYIVALLALFRKKAKTHR